MKKTIVLLDNVRSALNVGAIFRTCEGAGVSKLYLAGITPAPPHPKVLKTSLGTHESLNYQKVDSALDIIKKYSEEGYAIIAMEETQDSKDFYKQSFEKDVLVIFGHEISGVSPEIMKNADFVLKLPMLGKKNSLNVATTVGITLYHIQFGQNGLKNN